MFVHCDGVLRRRGFVRENKQAAWNDFFRNKSHELVCANLFGIETRSRQKNSTQGY